jgi:Fic family protein
MQESKFRAGKYITQPTGYKAFIPNPLPPDPPIQMNNKLITLLSKAELALGRLDGSTEVLPNPDLFVFMYVRKEAVLSSQIEGTQASLIDLLEYEARAKEEGKVKDVKEVSNYVAALNYGMERVAKLPLSLRLLKEIHAKLLSNVRGSERNPGEFRTSQNWIGAQGSLLKDASFVPPPPFEMKQAMGELENFIHKENEMPLLLKAGLIHAQFETIHPFLDGNGRMGRLLITFFLCQKGLLKRPLLYLSHYFKKHRAQYYDLLQNIRDEGDWENWLFFFLKGVAEVSEEATDTAKRIVRLREEFRENIQKHFGKNSGNPLKVLEMLFNSPFVTINDISDITRLSYSSANNLGKELEKIGILEETTGQKRNRIFVFRPYVDVFVE